MAKGKKGKKGGAKAEHEAKLLALEKQIENAQIALEEERRAREKMSRDKAGLLSKLAALEETLAKLQEDNAQALEDANARVAKDLGAKKRTLASVRARLNELNSNLAALPVVDKENTRLNDDLRKAEQELADETRDNHIEEERLKQEAFNMRMQLENLSR